MSRLARALLLSVLGAGPLGCVHAESHAALFREAGPPVSSVEIVPADTPVLRPYTEIGLVQAIGFGDGGADAALAELRAKAGALGCDGVIRVHVDVGYSRSHGAGVCVRWEGRSPAQAAETPVQMSPPPAPPPSPPPPPRSLTHEPAVRGADQPGALQ